jgi:hypothetical protein
MAKQHRNLTELEEKIIRLHHHEFAGMSLAFTAGMVGLSMRAIKTALQAIKKKAPSLFPILTKQQQAILHLYDNHTSRKVIAAALEISEKQLGKEITFLYEHGFLCNHHKIKKYDPSMDGDVKERF